jgi:hypothetical protein
MVSENFPEEFVSSSEAEEQKKESSAEQFPIAAVAGFFKDFSENHREQMNAGAEEINIGPVIANLIGEIEKLLEKAKNGILNPKFKEKEYSDVIAREVYAHLGTFPVLENTGNDPELLEKDFEIRKKARDYILEYVGS